MREELAFKTGGYNLDSFVTNLSLTGADMNEDSPKPGAVFLFPSPLFPFHACFAGFKLAQSVNRDTLYRTKLALFYNNETSDLNLPTQRIEHSAQVTYNFYSKNLKRQLGKMKNAKYQSKKTTNSVRKEAP
jgi:hypothetical protein